MLMLDFQGNEGCKILVKPFIFRLLNSKHSSERERRDVLVQPWFHRLTFFSLAINGAIHLYIYLLELYIYSTSAFQARKEPNIFDPSQVNYVHRKLSSGGQGAGTAAFERV